MKKLNTPNRDAKMAGFLYLLLVPLGVFGILYIPDNLIIAGDLSATIEQINAHRVAFTLSIFCALLIQLVNLAVVIYLYQLFKGVNKKQAILMVIFILLAAPLAMANELNHIAVLYLLGHMGPPALSLTPAMEELIPLFLALHESGIMIAGVFWGLWLLPMGCLVFRSNFMPKIIGVFLIIGGWGYIVDFVTFFVLPERTFLLSNYTFMGELLMIFWLLFKGVNEKQWHKWSSNKA